MRKAPVLKRKKFKVPQWAKSLRQCRNEVMKLRVALGQPVVWDGDPLEITWAEFYGSPAWQTWSQKRRG